MMQGIPLWRVGPVFCFGGVEMYRRPRSLQRNENREERLDSDAAVLLVFDVLVLTSFA